MAPIRRYIPIALIDLAVILNRKRHGFLGKFESFDDALEECIGYEDPNIVQVYLEKYESEIKHDAANYGDSVLIDREIRLINALQYAVASLPNKSSVKVLDFGGGFGMHYPIVKTFLHDKLDEFVVCESPAVANALSKFNSEQLSWISDINNLNQGSVDVIITSGTIQCLSSPFETLESMSSLSEWIVLDRVPVIEGQHTQLMRQNTVTSKGDRTSYPGWFFSEKDLLDWFEKLHLKIEFEWKVPEDRPYVNGKRLPYRGYMLRKSLPNV